MSTSTTQDSPGLASIDRLCAEGGSVMLDLLRADPSLVPAFAAGAWEDPVVRAHYLELATLEHFIGAVVDGTLAPEPGWRDSVPALG